MIFKNASASLNLTCDYAGASCSAVYRPRPKVVDVTVTAAQRDELARELRARAHRQGWSGAGGRDFCPAHPRA